jgi:hypothetical protein
MLLQVFSGRLPDRDWSAAGVRAANTEKHGLGGGSVRCLGECLYYLWVLFTGFEGHCVISPSVFVFWDRNSLSPWEKAAGRVLGCLITFWLTPGSRQPNHLCSCWHRFTVCTVYRSMLLSGPAVPALTHRVAHGPGGQDSVQCRIACSGWRSGQLLRNIQLLIMFLSGMWSRRRQFQLAMLIGMGKRDRGSSFDIPVWNMTA